MNEWSVIYEKAVRDDGSLFFPERLTPEFLDSARKTMGSYLFANQYQNIIIPDEEKRFRPNWLKNYQTKPENTYSFAFIDPAIGQHDRHDYTGIVVIHTDCDGHWYLAVAKRERLTPSQIVDKCFEMQAQFSCQGIGIEIVAYQEALLYFLDQEMKRRKMILPIKGIRRNQVSKEARILGLVPRFEWGRISIKEGMFDFEDEYNSFPRGTHDDILDSLASCEEIVFYPQKKGNTNEKPHSANDPNYERWYIQQLARRANNGDE